MMHSYMFIVLLMLIHFLVRYKTTINQQFVSQFHNTYLDTFINECIDISNVTGTLAIFS